jgi:hypothetical protein
MGATRSEKHEHARNSLPEELRPIFGKRPAECVLRGVVA